MLERLLRSPINSIIIWSFLIFYGVMFTTEGNRDWLLWSQIVFLLVQLILSYSIGVYNEKHPNHQMSSKGWYTWNFQEEGEGQQCINYRACRNVYNFFHIGLPITFCIILLFPQNRLLMVFLLGFLGMGQSLVYWATSRKYNHK